MCNKIGWRLFVGHGGIIYDITFPSTYFAPTEVVCVIHPLHIHDLCTFLFPLDSSCVYFDFLLPLRLSKHNTHTHTNTKFPSRIARQHNSLIRFYALNLIIPNNFRSCSQIKCILWFIFRLNWQHPIYSPPACLPTGACFQWNWIWFELFACYYTFVRENEI